MADSWEKYLYKKHNAFAVGPFTSESSVQLLDVLVKTRGSNPTLYIVGSMVNLGSKESQSTADRLGKVLEALESNQDHELIKRDTSGISIKHTVKSRASLLSSLRILGGAGQLDLDGDRNLVCKLKGLEVTSVKRNKLLEYIANEEWKPNVHKLKKLQHRSKPSRGVLKCFGESVQDLWVIYDILKAKKVSLTSVDAHSGAVGADVTALLPVGGPPVGANLSFSATSNTKFRFELPDSEVRAFGFRALHAQFDSTGELIQVVHDEGFSLTGGRRAPTVSENPRLDFEGLFLKPPGDIKDDNEDLECLEIEVI
ncbi:unnamed protein product [Sphagnum troendelagicum]|uniref:Uncharacterized protein n=1 Tax=Sphagnum troendelagicum TaxID=128251 RepID=A0ABP0THU6_9BRYO